MIAGRISPRRESFRPPLPLALPWHAPMLQPALLKTDITSTSKRGSSAAIIGSAKQRTKVPRLKKQSDVSCGKSWQVLAWKREWVGFVIVVERLLINQLVLPQDAPEPFSRDATSHILTHLGGQTAANPNIAGWSSPVAREAHNLEVAGSNPVPATPGRCEKSLLLANPGKAGVFYMR